MFAEINFYDMNFRVDYFLTDYTTFRQIRENLHRQIFFILLSTNFVYFSIRKYKSTQIFCRSFLSMVSVLKRIILLFSTLNYE